MSLTQALYERVIIEILEDPNTDTSPVKGIENETRIIKVKVHHWGTLVDGTAFPFPAGLTAGIQAGAKLTKLSDDRFMVDRRLILGIE